MTEFAALLLAADEPNSAYLFWGVVLFAVALGIVGLELVVPSGGLLALMAGAAVVASIVSFFMYSPEAGFIALLGYLVLGPIVIYFGMRLWMNSPLAARFVLGGSVSEPSTPSLEEMSGEEAAEPRSAAAALRDLIGAEGLTVTPLRPVGTVKIEGHRVEALAENGTIDANTPVIVTDVYDNQIKVRPR